MTMTERGIRHGTCGGYHRTMDEARICDGLQPKVFFDPGITTGVATYNSHRMPTPPMTRKIEELMLHPAIPQLYRDGIQDYLLNRRFTFNGASSTIGKLKALIADDSVSDDGIYIDTNGTVWKVQEAKHGSGNLYAKRMNVIAQAIRDIDGKIVEPADVEWIYSPGAITKLSKTWRLTPDAAKKFGDLYGRCIQCHIPLTKEASIERGMGDKCAERYSF